MRNTDVLSVMLMIVAPVAITISRPLDTLAQAEVRLTNKSILYGEVKKLEFAELTLDTDDFGLVSVDWDPIVYMKAPGPFAVRLENGETVSGAIEVDSVSATITGDTTITVPRSEIASFKDFDVGFWHRASADVGIGANIVRGNSDVTSAQVSLGLGWASDVVEVALGGTAMLNEQTNADDTRRYTAFARVDRSIVGRLRGGEAVSPTRATRISSWTIVCSSVSSLSIDRYPNSEPG